VLNPYHHDLNENPNFFPPEALVGISHGGEKDLVCLHRKTLTPGHIVVAYSSAFYLNAGILFFQHTGPYSPIQFASHQVNKELKGK
jgi:hypothetical protein